MAEKKRTSSVKPDYRAFQIAGIYADSDECTRTMPRLVSLLRKIPAFDDFMKDIHFTFMHLDDSGRFVRVSGERVSAEREIMGHVARAFYAGVAYGQRFGDNLSQPLPRVDPEYIQARRLRQPDPNERKAARLDQAEVKRWRAEAGLPLQE